MPKVSVIVSAKDDKRLLRLIRRLEKQTFQDFEVLILDASKERIFNEDTSLNLRYFHIRDLSIADSIAFLAKKAKAELVAITETDCVQSKRWLEELVSEYENETTIIVGAQVTMLHPSIDFGNLLVPKRAFNIPVDRSLRLAEDTDWFFSLRESGFLFKHINKAVVRHYKNPKKAIFRSIKYGKAHAYVYTKHKKQEDLLNSIMYHAAQSFFSAVTTLFLVIFGVFYRIKFFLAELSKR